MLGLFGRRKDPEAEELEAKRKAKETLKEELEKQKERERRRELGPNLVPSYILLVTAILGVGFWLYGLWLESGVDGIMQSLTSSLDTSPDSPTTRNTEGLIIFEKD